MKLKFLIETDEDLRKAERLAQMGDIDALGKAFRAHRRVSSPSEFDASSIKKQAEKLDRLGGIPSSGYEGDDFWGVYRSVMRNAIVSNDTALQEYVRAYLFNTPRDELSVEGFLEYLEFDMIDDDGVWQINVYDAHSGENATLEQVRNVLDDQATDEGDGVFHTRLPEHLARVLYNGGHIDTVIDGIHIVGESP